MNDAVDIRWYGPNCGDPNDFFFEIRKNLTTLGSATRCMMMETQAFKISNIARCDISVILTDENSKVTLDSESKKRIGDMFSQSIGWKFDVASNSLRRINFALPKRMSKKQISGRKENSNYSTNSNLNDLKKELKAKNIPLPEYYSSITTREDKIKTLKSIIASITNK